MAYEIIYLGFDNYNALLLKVDGVSYDLTDITRMDLYFGSQNITSTNEDDDPIRWQKAGYATGEVRLYLGGETIDPGEYGAVLVVFDAANPKGLVWGSFKAYVTEVG